ncbi:MFS transporter [Propionibacterium australiense]|uniref:Gph: sugar (Glycoside-Pentoside-Hexuronide) transporter n=1 Tax=Propionibacterium australiense TaxID=119981 RepID=A0A383S979_9ACTN|nr:MFS transporter [Propionibacterium australiense]RLP09585.1 MFS transporter [Propionibacterium australiense]RLP12287.1 MFS transporter [Propionibacterium australiense]SYZ34538.1 gph: sugar (Glycoside-Pentoside-Hexuronide) transporter [Propionibacterium australiense]VEH89686.1 Glucuronide permease [Propionibacterium australiense]
MSENGISGQGIVSTSRVGSSLEPEDKLSFTTKLAYGGGDVGFQLAWSLGGSYLALFYTDNVGLSAGVAAMVILIARILDGILNLVIGGVSERTQTRWGRFRPYLLFGTPFVALMTVLTFTAPFQSNGAKFVWAVATYFILGIIYALVNLPYGALATVMSRSTEERLSLNSYRMAGTNIGALLLSLVTMPLILYFSGFGDGETTSVHGYTMTALIMAVLSVPLLYMVFFTSKEVIKPVQKTRTFSLGQEIRVVLGNRNLWMAFLAYLLALIGYFGRMATQLYYYIYVLNRTDLVPILMAITPLMGAVGIMLFTRFARVLGKRYLAMISMVLAGISLFVLFLVPYDNIPGVMIMTAIFGLANFAGPIIMSMVPDSIDEAEDKTGIRADGMSYSVITVSYTVAQAIGGALGVALIGALGYVPNAAQTPQAMDGINLVTNVVLGSFFMLGLIPLFFYKLPESEYKKIRARLDAKAQDAVGRD